MNVSTDCIHYKGDVPCKPHKKYGKKCRCDKYITKGKKILLIKLGAAGDVIRTTPLIRKLKNEYPNCEITWITYSPDFIENIVEHAVKMNYVNVLKILPQKFDIIYNLDKDKEACALTNMIEADLKKGFFLKDGKCHPIDKDAEHKWLTGLFDDVSRENRKNYMKEIFEICGFQFNGEKYIFKKKLSREWSLGSKNIIGLNTGCGSRWSTRLWPESFWAELSKKLIKNNYSVVLLGGEQEHERNKNISKQSGALYPGHFPINEFVDLIDQCDVIITGVTMAMHIAIGLGKKIVLMNNTFNNSEFELYGLGKIINPDVECIGCFNGSCQKECMEKISPDEIFENVSKLVG